MHKKYLHWLFISLVLLIVLIVSIIISLSFGEISFSFTDIFSVLKNSDNDLKYTILTKIRLPRIILGLAVGGALSLSGTILQGIYRNPLVEPYTLGISGGAALGVSLVITTNSQNLVQSLTLPLAGFSGSVTVLFFIWIFSMRKGNIHTNNMLLTGVMISFIASSLMMLMMAVASKESLHGIIFWTMGSLDEPDIRLIKITMISALAGLILSYFFARDLNAFRLGKEKAMQMGIHSERSIRLLFITASLLTGVSVAVAGIIGFIGLIVPHIMRRITGNDYRILLLSSFLGGGAFLVLSDTLARTVISPNELPVGVITGIAGGITFMFVLSKTKK